MIRMTRLLSRSRVRMLKFGAVGVGIGVGIGVAVGRGGHGSTVNFNYRRWSSGSSSPVHPISAELLKEEVYKRDSHGTIDEAKLDKVIDFMMEAEHVFQDEPEKFYVIRTLLEDFRDGRIDSSVFKEGMMELFKGHNNLIWKFNNALPPGVTPLPLDDEGLPFKYDSTAFRDDTE